MVGLLGALFWANSRSDESDKFDDAEAAISDDSTGDSGSDGDGNDSSSVTASPGPAIDLPTDPVAGDLVYSCAGRRFTADELAAALGSDGATDDELSAAGHSLETLGRADGWALTSTAVAVATEALPTDPPALVIAEPGQAPFPCVAVRAGGFDGRSVAWERIGDDIVVESCVSPDELVVDSRDVDGTTVLSVFAPLDEDLGAGLGAENCRLNGDVTLDADTDAELSSLTFPFIASSASTWELLGFGNNVAPLDASTLGVIECAVSADTTDVFVQWSSIPAGFDVTVVGDGEDLFTAERTSFDESAGLVTAFVSAMDDLGAAVDVAGPEGFVNGFSDFTAPIEGERAYEIRVEGGGVEPVSVDCGQAGLVPGGPTATTQPSANVSGDLDSARMLFQSRAVSPYGYMRVVGICPTCDGRPVELILQPSSVTGVSLDFDPPLTSQGGSDLAAVMINPFILHDSLIAAEAEGRDVSYSLDPTSGIPVEWTIDGEGARIECFEVDTAPPDLRANDSCSVDLDLIGS